MERDIHGMTATTRVGSIRSSRRAYPGAKPYHGSLMIRLRVARARARLAEVDGEVCAMGLATFTRERYYGSH